MKSTAAQEAPVPAKSFYGDVDPITSLKVLKAVPTLKSAFSARTGELKESQKEPATKKKTSGRLAVATLAARILLRLLNKVLELFIAEITIQDKFLL